jgi:flagellar hook-length control protein FliK
MDMSNATSAGPSRGLLDVIFGSGKQEPDDALTDGEGFGNLMKLMSALNGKKEAEDGTGAGRTLRETVLGKGVAESNAADNKMPGMSNNAVSMNADAQLDDIAKLQEEKEKLTAQRQSLLSLTAVPAVTQTPLQGPSPEQVNEVLRQKNLPALSPPEMKLLQDVNGKLAKQPAQPEQGVEIPAEFTAADAALLDPVKAKAIPKAATAVQPALDPQLQKAMAGKGLDPRKLKSTEVSDDAAVSGAPDKMVSTESYLQLHESMNSQGAKPVIKEIAEKGSQSGPQSAQAGRAPDGSLTANAVAGAAKKGLGSATGEQAEKATPGAKQAKLDAAAGSSFNAMLSQKSEVIQKDLYVPAGSKPEQVKSALVAELGTNVSFHAHKGGGEMKIILHPDDMGEVHVKVGTKNGKVEVQVTAQNEDVAKLLRGGSKDLESSLKGQNLALAKFEVTVNDSGSVMATDTKTSLNEQFLSQQQPQHQGGFAQANSDQGRSGGRWNSEQGSQQGGGYASLSDESARNSARASAFSAPRNRASASMGSSRRLDVVA